MHAEDLCEACGHSIDHHSGGLTGSCHHRTKTSTCGCPTFRPCTPGKRVGTVEATPRAQDVLAHGPGGTCECGHWKGWHGLGDLSHMRCSVKHCACTEYRDKGRWEEPEGQALKDAIQARRGQGAWSEPEEGTRIPTDPVEAYKAGKAAGRALREQTLAEMVKNLDQDGIERLSVKLGCYRMPGETAKTFAVRLSHRMVEHAREQWAREDQGT